MTWQLWILLWLIATQAPRPPVPIPSNAPPAGTGSIEGTVVHATSGRTLAGVRVEIRQARQGTVTDSSGRFRFLSIAPGRYTLTAEREGYILLEDPKRALSSTGMIFRINSGQSLRNVALPMISAPTISGVTYNPSGEPLAAAAVHAYRWRITPSGPRLRIVRTALTNDLGEFRMFWLGFGDYVVSASYSRTAQRAALGGIRLSDNLSNPDDGYATVFHGGGTNPSQAGTVRVAPGFDAGSLNILFGEAPRLKIQGRFVSAVRLPSDLRVVFVPEGSDVLENLAFPVSAGADGAFEIRGVSPGSYVILAYGAGLSSDVVPVTVAEEDIQKLDIPLFPTMKVEGRVSLDAGRSNLQGMKVSLVRNSKEIEQRLEALTAVDGTFTVWDVGPGEYDVFVDRMPTGAYTSSIRIGGRDVLSSGMRPGFDSIDPNSRMEIVVSSRPATVEGKVTDRIGEPSSGIQVVLVPEPRLRRRTDRYLVGFTDSSGNFQIDTIPPGRYTAYAFEQIEQGAYFAFGYNPSLSQQFADRGVSVNVNDAARTTDVQLKLIPASDTLGGFR